FRPHRLGVAHDEIAQRRAATGRVFEARGRNRGKSPRDLHSRPGKRQSRSQAALQADSALSADRGGLDHVAFTGGDKLRDHPSVGEIDLIDRIAGTVTDDALRQGELPQIGLQEDKRIVGQGGEKAVSYRPGRRHRPVRQRITLGHDLSLRRAKYTPVTSACVTIRSPAPRLTRCSKIPECFSWHVLPTLHEQAKVSFYDRVDQA